MVKDEVCLVVHGDKGKAILLYHDGTINRALLRSQERADFDLPQTCFVVGEITSSAIPPNLENKDLTQLKPM
jgi:hypothetical protein